MTADNYILTLWRVALLNPPSKDSKPKQYPIILQHGLLDSAFSWILNGKNQSLAYILASLGYDVWLTNNRGNKFSFEHKDLTVSDEEYWNFSFDEMAQFDLPTNIEYVKKQTSASKVVFIGHSQGTTQLFAHLTENPKFKENIKVFFGLGPVVKVDHQESSLIKAMESMKIVDILNFLGVGSMMYLSSDTFPTLGIICDKLSDLCVDTVRLLCGNTKVVHFNHSRMSVMASHEPGGTSIKNMMHWLSFCHFFYKKIFLIILLIFLDNRFQMMKSGEFRKYDYGKERNNAKYDSDQAPLYDVKNLMNFDVEKHLYIGGKDYLADSVDYPLCGALTLMNSFIRI